MQQHELTVQSQQAIKNRVAQQRWAKTCAEQRYIAECEIIKARKSRNRSILTTLLVCIGLTSVAVDISHRPETGAKAGPITAKSEMSQAEIKALNIAPTVSEKRK